MIICTQKLWVRPNIPWQLKYPEISAHHIEPCSSRQACHNNKQFWRLASTSWQGAHRQERTGIDRQEGGRHLFLPHDRLDILSSPASKAKQGRAAWYLGGEGGAHRYRHKAPQGALPHAYTQPAPCASLSIDTMCLNITVAAAETSCFFPTFGWIMRWRIPNILQGN